MSTCTRTQGFGQNLNPLYAEAGQKGHTGVDDTCGYGSKIYALKPGYVYKILDATHPARDGSGYWGVFMICQEPDGRWIEWQIGHCSKIYVKPGDVVQPWDFIGEEGNRGGVYYNGQQITKAMQDAGDQRGSHRHYNKKYLTLVNDQQLEAAGANAQYLTDFNAPGQPINLTKSPDGLYYSVVAWNNGYNGSVDCAKDIDDGRVLVEKHFEDLSHPDPVPPPTCNDIEKRNKEVLGLMQTILSLIQQIVNKLKGKTGP